MSSETEQWRSSRSLRLISIPGLVLLPTAGVVVVANGAGWYGSSGRVDVGDMLLGLAMIFVLLPIFAWLTGWHSLIVVDDERLTVRNGLKTHLLPWASIDHANVGRSGIMVHVIDGQKKSVIVAAAGQGFWDPTMFRRAGKRNRHIVDVINARATGTTSQ